jgi:hypothetical protein
MKKTLLFTAVFFCLLQLAPSCTKQSEEHFTAPASAPNYITATIASGQTYTYTAGQTGTLSISRQASHYQVSEAAIDGKNGAVIYRYIAAAGYKGPDEVTLIHTITSSGNNNNGCPGGHGPTTTSNSINIKIDVTN